MATWRTLLSPTAHIWKLNHLYPMQSNVIVLFNNDKHLFKSNNFSVPLYNAIQFSTNIGVPCWLLKSDYV